MSSVFTKIIEGKLSSYKIAETDNYFAFLDINPLTLGHTLAVPKVEIDYIFDLDYETYSGLFIFAHEVAKALKKSVDCLRIGMAVVGLEVPHTHIHLVPIQKVSDMDFSNPRLTLSPDQFEELASKIRRNLV